MRSLYIAALLVVLASGAALAKEDVMASRYGNTMISTDRDGSTTKHYYRADHTFTAKHGYDWSSDGTWSLEAGRLCLTYQFKRPGLGNSECRTAELRQIGEKWVDNGRRTTLVKGIQY
jgi:hypothetical protein